jgi:hypothetical protein
MSNSCPLCLTTLPATPSWMCASGRCSVPPDAAPGVTGPITSGPESSVTSCRVCGGPVVEVCAVSTCHFMLPRRWRDTASTHVVMAGARASGKSVYLGVLVKQLELLGDLSGTRVAAATSRTAATYREDYERPLFEQRGILDPTRGQETTFGRLEPMIFEITPQVGARHFLVVTDVAGEDMERTPLDRSRLRAFAAADAVVLLYDPLSLPDVLAAVSGLVPEQRGTGDSWAVLSNVVDLVESRTPKVAVAVSKFDVLHSARSVPGVELGSIMANPGAAFCREPDRRGPYDEEDGLLLHEEIQSLLQWLGAASLVNAMGRLTNAHNVEHRFFAVSALGDAPEGAFLHDRGIAPFRCLDPLRWVLRGRT